MRPKQNDRLDSWKAIAAYLGRDVSTVIRWEKEKALPIHRIPGGKKQAVFAFREEIDTWLAGVGSLPEEPRERLSQGFATKVRWALVGALLLLVPLIVVAAFIRLHPTSTPTVADAAFRGNKLVALGESGQTLWSREFPRLIPETSPLDLARRKAIADVDGDGQTELLIAVPQSDPAIGDAPASELWCFSTRGDVAWQLAWPAKLRFRMDEFGPPWNFGSLQVYDAGGHRRILYAVSHIPWWPAALLRLNENGTLLDVFVNSGHVVTTNVVETPAGKFVLAGGTSNANDGAMLAVLDEKSISGSSPEASGSPFECLNCPAGKPLRYFVFPRSEVNQVTGSGVNHVFEISVREDRITARTFEQGWHETPGAIYEFSRDFELRQVRYTDGYWDVHRKLELEGKIRHAKAQCPERDGPRPVRIWSPENGWLTVQPNNSVANK